MVVLLHQMVSCVNAKVATFPSRVQRVAVTHVPSQLWTVPCMKSDVTSVAADTMAIQPLRNLFWLHIPKVGALGIRVEEYECEGVGGWAQHYVNVSVVAAMQHMFWVCASKRGYVRYRWFN